MALPETDLHRIRLWARERLPEHLWDQVKVEADVSERHVDIVEVRAPRWDGVGGTYGSRSRRFATPTPVAYGRSAGATAISSSTSTNASARPRTFRRSRTNIETGGDPTFWG